jgi:tRNA pseudouridine38-40 synthase
VGQTIQATVQYDGTDYFGFQFQDGSPTVQGTLDSALAIVTGETIRVTGAGRTDRGVHARAQVVSFTTEWSRSLEELQRGWNANLPDSIAVHSLETAIDGFDARRSARERTYRYSIDNRMLRQPLSTRYAWHVRPPLNERVMHAELQAYVGWHDFAAFGSPPKKENSSEREIMAARCWRELHWVYVELMANAFLRGMVRRIVGALVELGAGHLSAGEFASLLAAKDKQLVKWKAPPQGLCLWEVRY